MNTPEFETSLAMKKGYDSSWLDQALEIYNRTELKRSNREQVHQAFLQSQVVITVWIGTTLVGVGRAISDFKMYSGIFDVVVDPSVQGQGIGRRIMKALIEPLRETCIFLTSTFGNEEFYRSLGFRFHKTALALYPERMQHSPYLVQNYQIPQDLTCFGEFQVSLGSLADAHGSFLLNTQLGYSTEENSFTKRFCFLMNHPEHEMIVAKNRRNEVVAWMHLALRHLLEAEHFAQLAGIVVRETERNSGLGAHFLKIAEGWSRHHGMPEIVLNSSLHRERAHQFYIKNGYTHSKTSKVFRKMIDR